MKKAVLYDDFDINSFKSVVIEKIIENNEIVSILDDEYLDAGGGLLYKSIFPYMQNPKTVETTRPFLCIKVDHTNNDSYYVEEIDVTIYIVCNVKSIPERVRSFSTGEYISGISVDILGEEIKKTLTGLDTRWIGKLKCLSNREEVLYYDFPARILTFSAKKESYNI